MPYSTGTRRANSPLILDLVPGAAAAYSLRQLRYNYLGPAINVRRSSDNAAQDIAFDSNGNLDTGALLAFVGAGNSGFVTKWYDQSGRGYDAAQVTTAKQPRIVNAGSVETANSIPRVRFLLSASNVLLLSGSGLGLFSGVPGFTIITTSVLPNLTSTNIGLIFMASTNASSTSSKVSLGLTGTTNRLRSVNRRLDGDTAVITTSAADNAYTTNTIHVVSHRANYPAGTQQVLLDGVSNFTASTGSTGANSDTNTSAAIAIGADGSAGSPLDGSISELLVYQSDLADAIRQTLEANQKSYYGTP